MSDPPQLVLASSSPRRRDLLRDAGYRFLVRPPPVGERGVPPHGPPGAYVESLAYLKAEAAIDAHALAAGLILGADTAVELDGHLLGKPADPDDARRILSRLSGTRHQVLTGLALVDLARGRRLLAHAVTGIRMAEMSPEAIDAYVDSGEAMGKAGAYAVQETGDRYVQAMDGSRTNVVGLPMALLERMLNAAGYAPRVFRDG
jgi:septum formation protein